MMNKITSVANNPRWRQLNVRKRDLSGPPESLFAPVHGQFDPQTGRQEKRVEPSLVETPGGSFQSIALYGHGRSFAVTRCRMCK
jgi:hypothetical protein